MRYRILTAFFPGRAEAESALDRLLAAGIARQDITCFPKRVQRPDDLALKMGSKAADGAAWGALAGGVIGAFVGALGAGGALVIPGVGEVLAGPFVAALAAAGALGTIGAVLGAALGIRVPEFEVAYLRDALGVGGSLVGVRCLAERASDVAIILEASGARQVRRCRAQ